MAYEYKVVKVLVGKDIMTETELQTTMNKEGKNGWELIAVTHVLLGVGWGGNMPIICTFKRATP